MKHKTFFYFLLSIFFVGGCFSPSKSTCYSDFEKERYEEFFKKFLFLEKAVFTLYGSKPMTEIILYPDTPEEKLRGQEEAFAKLSAEELQQLQEESFEYDEEFWFEETWAMWEEKVRALPIKKYLFVERTQGIPPELQKNRYIYFINVEETQKIIKKYYSLFRDFVGFDFDPYSVVLDAKNPDSKFWNAFWGSDVSDKSVCLTGILFGFGYENSFPFSLSFSENLTPEEEKENRDLLQLATPTMAISDFKKFNPPQHFSLPAYISFLNPDPYKENYQKEYEQIRQIYSGSDIIECTLRQLTRE